MIYYKSNSNFKATSVLKWHKRNIIMTYIYIRAFARITSTRVVKTMKYTQILFIPKKKWTNITTDNSHFDTYFSTHSEFFFLVR